MVSKKKWWIMLEIPEKAIAAFETLTGKTICVHPMHYLVQTAIRKKYYHFYPFCERRKKTMDAVCVRFDWFEVRANLWKYADGAVKICPAGLLEWVMPVLFEKRCIAILFAAGSRPPSELPDGIPLLRATEEVPGIPLSDEPETSAGEVETIMEALRQLAARLTLWFESVQEKGHDPVELGREDLIQNFFQERYRMAPTLKELADLLFLSSSRTAHLVREMTGFSFSELLMRTRLIQAGRLLRGTDLPVSAVSRKSGFETPSHFFRAFRKHFRMTPAEYRAGKAHAGDENSSGASSSRRHRMERNDRS